MPLTKFKLSSIADGGISTAKLADGAVTLTKTDSLFVNTEISGTEAAKVPVGTTAQRANEQNGDIRFNSTINLMEYYDGTQWKAIDTPPSVTSISPTSESSANANIVISGTNFSSGATVKFIGNDGTEYNSPSVTVDSSAQITATTPSTPLSVANEPYDIKVIASSGLAGLLEDALDAGGVPAWDTASGSIGSIYDSARSSLSFSVSATDPDGDTVTYALASGSSLPSGLSLNTSTGAITGSTSSVGSDTTTTFDIEASTPSGDTVSRTFSITQRAPISQAFTYTGSDQSFSIPSGISTMTVHMWGGGGGGSANGFSGGSGGYTTGTLDVSSITTLTLIVGQAGTSAPAGNNQNRNERYGGGASSGGSGSHDYKQSHGAGRSAIRNGSTELATAGGGGGAGYSSGGGAGGGASGGAGIGYSSPGHSGTQGQGGTQTAGGATGSNGTEYGVAGIQFAGGYAGATSASESGGGGGGWYGGGGGGDNTGGGGGSGYVGGLESGATTTIGTQGNNSGSVNPPQTSNSYYASGIGVGSYGNSTGGNGRIVLVY